jgi:hypothetical protein
VEAVLVTDEPLGVWDVPSTAPVITVNTLDLRESRGC